MTRQLIPIIISSSPTEAPESCVIFNFSQRTLEPYIKISRRTHADVHNFFAIVSTKKKMTDEESGESKYIIEEKRHCMINKDNEIVTTLEEARCKHIFSMGTGTSSLRRHLTTKHDIVCNVRAADNSLDPVAKKSKQMSVNESFQYFPSSQQDILDSMLMELGVMHNLPGTVIGSALFRKLVQFLNPKACTICPQNYLININNLGELYRTKLKIKLQTIKYISCTMDLWSDDELLSFIGITIHWMEKDTSIHSLVLCCDPFNGRHTTFNINAKLLDALKDKYDILKKIVSMSTDNASNMNIQKHPEMQHIVHIKCLCHTIDLVLKDVENNKDKTYDAIHNLLVVMKFIIRKKQ